MRDLQADGRQWSKLHEDWVFKNQASRKLRLEVTRKFRACADGGGAGPTTAELEKLEQLEKLADEAKTAESAFLNDVFR